MADGDCQVGVNDHMNRMRFVREIVEGDIFGEVALILNRPRSATVVSSNYCTMATLSQDVLLLLFQTHTSIFNLMRKKALSYDIDPWKQFKIKLLG